MWHDEHSSLPRTCCIRPVICIAAYRNDVDEHAEQDERSARLGFVASAAGDDNVSWIGTASYSWGGGEAPFTKNALPAAQQFSTMVCLLVSPLASCSKALTEVAAK